MPTAKAVNSPPFWMTQPLFSHAAQVEAQTYRPSALLTAMQVRKARKCSKHRGSRIPEMEISYSPQTNNARITPCAKGLSAPFMRPASSTVHGATVYQFQPSTKPILRQPCPTSACIATKKYSFLAQIARAHAGNSTFGGACVCLTAAGMPQ